MFSKSLSTAVLAAAVAFGPVSKAAADAGDFVAGALIGGIIGHAATKEAQRKKTSSRVYRSGIPSTQVGREIQTSLNYFGFNAGGVDGQLGRRSREAISRYQIYMGYPPTGQLTPIEQEILLTSFSRAQLGSYEISQQMAVHPDGARGLLKNYRIELAGGSVQAPQPAAPQTTVVVAPQPIVTTTPNAAALPNLGVTSAAAPALPNFQAVPTPVSLTAHCNAIALVTTTNGGYTTVSSMTDPNLVLNEQFCLARTYAIETSERLASQVAGLTTDQIAQQCEAFGPAMASYVAALPSKTQAASLQDVQGFIPATGMSPAQLQGTAQICLGVGYRTDNMDVALGSALLLVAAGQPVYAELVGHHLMRGFGVAPQQAVARGWFDQGFNALSSGVVPVFNPGEPGRTALLQQAVASMN